MPPEVRAYSMDLRERVVATVDAGLTQSQAAARFGGGRGGGGGSPARRGAAARGAGAARGGAVPGGAGGDRQPGGDPTAARTVAEGPAATAGLAARPA